MKEEEIKKGVAQSNFTLPETQIMTVEQQGLAVKLGQALEGRGGV